MEMTDQELQQTLDGIAGATLELTGTASKPTVPESNQTAFEFPQPWTEKYRPRDLGGFVGLERVKKIMSALIAAPKPSNWYFLGPSGMGKTTLAQAIAEMMPAQLHHVPARECTIDTVRELARQCHYMPRIFETGKACKMHLVIVDEADQMTAPAQLAFLSLLDSACPLPNTIVIMTGNSTENLEPRFLSRVKLLEFSKHAVSDQIVSLLARVWSLECPGAPTPNFARIVKDNANNVRGCLNDLEVEAMAL